MKQSTFSAQVANNLLTVLQGYSKTIRLLLVMFLTLTASAAWGAALTGNYTKITNISNLSAGDRVVLYADDISKGVTGWNGSKDATVSGSGWVEYLVESASGGVYLKDENADNYIASPGSSNQFKYGTKAVCTVDEDGVLKCNNRFLVQNGTYYRMYSSIGSYKPFYVYKVSTTAPSYEITVKSNNDAYGSVSILGKTITATPNAGYRVKSGDAGYTVTSGTAVVTNNGNNTFSVTPSSNCTITIIFEAIPKYTVTWNVNGEVYETTQVTEGSKPTFPATPSSCDATSNTFYGWTTATWDGKINDVSAKTIYTSANNMPAEAATYYAVFCEGGGGSVLINESFDNNSSSDASQAFSSSTFPNFNGTTEKAYKSQYGGVKLGASSAVGYITSKSLDLSTAFTVTLDACKYGSDAGNIEVTVGTQTKTISNSSLGAAGTFKTFTLEFDAATSTSTVKIGTSSKRAYIDNVIIATGGGASNFITTCAAGDPCASLQAPNVTATATANSITLSWAAVDGATSYNIYNYTTEDLDETTSLTYTFTGLSSETEYEWGVESAKDECFKETRGTTTTSATPCEQLGAATGLTVETDFVQDGQTYVKFSWTPADNTKNYATNQKICFGKVDEAGTCVDDLEKNLTWTGDLKSKLEPGEYWWSIQALGDGVNYCDGDVVNGTNFTIEAPKASITLSELGVTTTDNTTYYVGAQYTLPTTSSQSCDGKELVGWSTVEVVAESDTKPTENYYELGAEVTLAATQTFYAVFAAGSGGGGETWTLVTNASNLKVDDQIVIAANEYNYAISTTQNGNNRGQAAVTKNGETITFGNDVQVLTLQTGNVSNSFAFYTGSGYLYAASSSSNYLRTENTLSNNSSWSIEITNAGVATITAQGTNTKNLLRYNSSSSIFSCYSSGQLDVSIYKKAGGGGYTAYSTSCIPTYSITYDFVGGTGSHCSNTSVPQGDPYTICDEAPTKDGNTFLHWSDGVNTYDPSDVIETVTTDITLTAVWQPNTYTVTWNSNGEETEVPYNHGVALVVPEEPESCDGVKEFVGWTTHSGYYHATTAPDDIFTTKTTPVTATATYYAVFATPGAGGTEFVLGESGTFKMYANVNGTNYYAQGGVSSSKLSSTTDILTASDYTLTYADGSYTIKQGTSTIGHSSSTNLSTTASTWTISAGANGSWRITSDKDNSRALSYSAEANAFKAYATSNLTAGNETYFDIEFGTGSSGYSDYTTICQTVESIEIANYTTEFFVTDEFAFGGTVTAHFDEGEPQDVTALAHFSGYNMNEVGTYTVTVTYMGATATYEITVKPLDNAWVLTWNVSGKTNTGLGPRSVTKNSAIGTLPVPEVPAACAGKTFMGWTESNIVPSDGKGIVYITEETVPSKNTTYYAVFATINNFSTQAAIEDIKTGSKVVIVAVASMDASGGAGQAISSRTISITSQGVIGLSGDEVSIFDETINTPHSTCIWTLTKEGGGIVFEQGGKYIRAVNNGYRRLLLETTKDYWTLSPVGGKDKTYHMQSGNTSHYVEWFDHTDSKYDEGERYIGFVPYTEANDNGDFDMQFYVTANSDGNADITDYTTGCAEYTITYYGFHGGYSTSCSSDGTIVLPVNSLHTVPNCGDVVKDHTNLGREFLNVWMTQPHGGHTFNPGDTFILTQDTTLYAQWKMETTSDVTTLPTDIEDLAGTDIYVYGGTTLNIQPGTTTINSLTLKGGLQADGSYKMPTVWVPEGATLVRNSNKIYLDLKVNAKNYYPFAVPFAAKNNENVEYLDPVLAAASYYGTHFVIKTYNGARRAEVGEDKANNWVRVLRDETLQPGVGYIITALTYPDEDTATIRIPMTVPNTWFKNGEQAAVNTTVRNTIAVTAHTGPATDINNGGHQRHAGWNFVANPYLTSFAGGNVANDGGLDYINGELIIQGSYVYGGDPVPYVTIPAYDFAYYSQHKLSDVKLSPEWSFFVQVGTGGTMNFTTAGRQQAPASIAARNAEERPVKMDVDLILSDNHSSDQTGLIICDRYSDAYEIGCDLEKLFGSAYNLSVYTLMEDNTPLAFQALAIRSSMQVIPVGYRAPEQGEYTFRLNEATSSIDLLNEQYEQLVLVDYQTGELTNLLYTDYTFYSERTQSNSRFAIYAVPRQNAPTDLPNAIGSDEEVRKVIYNDHLYILRDGNVYNGMGQKM